MTSNPITIAGETLTEADWPEGCLYFTRPYWRGVLMADMGQYPNELRICVAVARCHFLDKAKVESDLMYEKYGYLKYVGTPDYYRYLGYLQSAEKWARIGRAK